MSLLLDALRRAAATREAPEADRYTVPRRAGAADTGAPDTHHEDPRAAEPRAPGPESPQREDDLALVPPEDEPRHAAAQMRREPVDARAPEPRASREGTAPDGRRRETADALLRAGAAARRGRGPLVLGLTCAAGVALAALGGGGWLWYQQSRNQVSSALGSYDPQIARAQSRPPAPSSGETPRAAAAAEAPAAPDAAELLPIPPAQDSSASESFDDSGESPSGPEPSSGAPAAGDATTAPANASAEAATAASAPREESTEPPSKAPASPSGQPADSDGNAGEERTQTADAASAADGNAAAEAADTAAPREARAAAAAGPDAAARPAPRQARPLVKVARGAPLAETLDIGYRALRAGNMAAADAAYGRAYRLDPQNRDALLGLAVIRQRQGATAAARDLYMQVLDAHPRDPYARAALSALDGGTPRRNETRLKTLLRDAPNTPALNFALGNLYAAERRWGDARQAYARAAHTAPDDPDYAYNLAVSLDHLGQREAALEAYERALRLADGAAVPDFDPLAVHRRVQRLQ